MAAYAPLPPGKVRLISSDGFEFILDDDAARVSTTIRTMLDSQGDFTETTERTVRLGDIPARVLERCCQYFHFKLRHADTPSGAVPAFPIPPELVLELLMAANYLDA